MRICPNGTERTAVCRFSSKTTSHKLWLEVLHARQRTDRLLLVSERAHCRAWPNIV